MNMKQIAGWTLAVTVVGVVIGAVGLTLAGGGGNRVSTSISGTGNTLGGCGIGNISGTVVCPPPTSVPSDVADDEAARSIARPHVTPVGQGPWAFTVLHDQKIGLFVRNEPGKAGFHIGLLPHGQMAYVDCFTTSDFDPEPALGYGPRWFKIHWPSTVEQDTALTSSPSMPAQGWAWGYYLTLNGHNGQIPQCAA